jgi:LCP family protein required for cell wall assembly
MPTETVNRQKSGNGGGSGIGPLPERPLRRQSSYSRRMVKKFFLLVGSIVCVFVLAASVGLYVYSKSTEAKATDFEITAPTDKPVSEGDANEEPPSADQPEGGSPAAAAENSTENASLVPLKTNFLIVGEDAGEMLTDVILVGSFDRETKDINVVSVPRDTYTVLPRERISQMKSLGLYPPSDGVMKMNAVHSYGGKKYGMILLQQQLEDLLGIDIQYYIEINLKAFRDIVDAIGGVDMTIRRQGYYYSDPDQNLRIAVPGGLQHLDGKMAEGVVRYRDDYAEGDIDRIKVQQEFLSLLFQQALDKDHIIQNAYGISKAILSYTKTNFGLGDIGKYISFIGDLKTGNIHFETLPGESAWVSKVSYFLIDQKGIDEMVSLKFNPEGSKKAQKDLRIESAKSSKDAAIQVLNGAQLAGIASKYKDRLKTDGYNVANIGNYTGAYKPYTRILVKEPGLGEDLLAYFTDPIISVESNMPERFDIVIIIGRDESV